MQESLGSIGESLTSSGPVLVSLPVERAGTDKLEVSGEYRRFDNPLYTHTHHVYESIL